MWESYLPSFPEWEGKQIQSGGSTDKETFWALQSSQRVIEATLKIKPPTRHTKKVEDLSSSKIMYTLKLIHNQFKNKKVKKQEQTEKNDHKITIFQKLVSSNIKIYNPKIVVVVDHFYIALFSVLEQTSALLSHAILNSK